ncbi:MAG: gamma carbonic anhydrase family protein [Solirubrobacterales bacterium]|nr:gamma carbonic anhydrase family protein [Solirubrobacterales bacterium]
MATIVELDGIAPRIADDAFLAPTAVVIGDVRIAPRANVWYGAVLRGDASHIEIGPECSVQDNTVIHCAHELPTVVGARVVVGHAAMLEGCVVEDDAVIGMGAIVLQRAHVGARAMVAAGAVVSERSELEPATLYAGVPARRKKRLSGSALRWTETAADEYQRYSERHRHRSRVHPS